MPSPFINARVTAYYRTYPLQNEGDPEAVVYHMICKQNETDYNRPALDTTMASAENANVIELPWTDADAYFVGDYNHSPVDGGLVQFDRQFATKPKDLTGYFVGSRSYPFPGVQGIAYNVPVTADAANDSSNLWRYVEAAVANTTPAPQYMDTTYWLSSETAPTIPSTFAPTLGGSHVDFVSDGGGQSIVNGTAQNGEKFSAAYTVSATVPSASQYKAAVAAGTLRVIDPVIERYIGNIWVLKTYKMKSQ